MLLINFVALGAAQRLLLKSKAAEGELLIQALQQHLHCMASQHRENHVTFIKTLLEKSGYACVLILSADLKERWTVGDVEVPPVDLVQATRRAMASKQFNTELNGSTWGIFWRQKARLILSAPLFNEGTFYAGIGIVFPLQQIYHQVCHIQKFVLIYILINLILLTVIGRYRFSRLTIAPLKKLVETAEAHKDSGKALFLGGEKEGNEFNQLSNALNHMLDRISRDQEKLRRNVCSLKQANTDLKKAQNDIINAEKLASVGRLSAGIAHEIGNPIAIIMGYLELLKREDIVAWERKEFITRTENEIHRISHIIRQLLDLSRPSHDAAQKISIHEILSNIEAIFRYQPLIKKMGLKLCLSASQDSVRADATMLRQAFLNLVINAADAATQAGRPGELIIKTRNPHVNSATVDPILEIVFQDNGVGIPKDRLNRIFEPFYTTKAPGKGTGLGLSVCYMIIEASGGKILAESEEGTGTRIIVELPLCLGEEKANG